MIHQKELVPLKKKITTIAERINEFQIKSETTMKEAVIILSQMNKYADSVKEKKELLTKPLNEALKNARKMFAPLEEVYEGAIEMLRSKMTVYQTAEVARKREEEQKIAARVAPGKGNLSLETAAKKMAEIALVEKEVATDAGLVQFREVKRFEVMEIGKVPFTHLIVDEKAVTKSMKEGIEIPGIRYYTEQIPINYR